MKPRILKKGEVVRDLAPGALVPVKQEAGNVQPFLIITPISTTSLYGMLSEAGYFWSFHAARIVSINGTRDLTLEEQRKSSWYSSGWHAGGRHVKAGV